MFEREPVDNGLGLYFSCTFPVLTQLAVALVGSGTKVCERQVPEELVFFEDFVLNRSACELRRGGTVVSLQRIPFDLLSLLIERRGKLVTREEILERVWGKGVFVDTENAINTAIRKVRRALGDNPEAPRFVLTVPTKGYRFVAAVRETNQQITHGVGEAVRNARVYGRT